MHSARRSPRLPLAQRGAPALQLVSSHATRTNRKRSNFAASNRGEPRCHPAYGCDDDVVGADDDVVGCDEDVVGCDEDVVDVLVGGAVVVVVVVVDVVVVVVVVVGG